VCYGPCVGILCAKFGGVITVADCCKSLVLEVMPEQRSIDLWRRDLPFSGSKQQNLQTFLGDIGGQ